jgi:glycosyltransferase involved in cell wall biosynthesis
MRILFCPAHYRFDPSLGSEHSWAFGIADRVGRRWPCSVVVTGNTELQRDSPYRIISVHQQRIDPTSTWDVLSFALRYSFVGSIAAYRLRPDVIHHILPFAIDHTVNLAAFARRSSLALVVGPVQTPLPVNDSGMARVTSNRSLTRISARLSRAMLKRADRIIVISSKARDLLTSRGIDDELINTIPPGVDTERFRPLLPPNQKSPYKLVTVSHLYARKELDLLIDAMPIIRARVPGSTLHIIGDGPERPNLTALVRRHHLEAVVRFAGSVKPEHLPSEISSSALMVSASRAESFGQSYLEALACGTPVVAIENDGSTEVLDEHTGVIVRPARRPAEFATAVLQLLGDPARLAKMSVRARHKALTYFDWDRAVIPSYLKAYKDAIAHRQLIRLD